jgi:hypothetical protein
VIDPHNHGLLAN